MSEDLIDFWKKWIDGEEEIDVTAESIILKYSMINKKSDDGVKDWVCFNSIEKLYSFIKYLLLPSIQLTRSIGAKESQVYFDVCEYSETIKLLETFKLDSCKKDMEDYKKWFAEIEILENNEYSLEAIINFINIICCEVAETKDIFFELQLFENIKCVGNIIIKQYEDNNMLDILENKFKLSKDEIKDLFESIDNNKLVLKKILDLLNERSI